MDEIIDYFPDWDDENASVGDIFSRVLEAEEVQANAKDFLYSHVKELAEGVLATAPDNVKNLPFSPDIGLFALRGYPIDALLAQTDLTLFYAETRLALYEITACFSFDPESENVLSCCILTRNTGKGMKEAWTGTEWAKYWGIEEEGVRNCKKCADAEVCDIFAARLEGEKRAKEAAKVAKKIGKKFPKVLKILNKHHMNIAVFPDEARSEQ